MKVAIALALAAAAAGMPAHAGVNGTQVIGATRAVDIAEQAIDGQVLEVDLDRTGKRMVYEVDVAKGQSLHELKIDAKSGKIISTSTSRVGNYWRQLFASDALNSAARSRPLSELLKKLEGSTGGRVREASFEMEHGEPRYEVEISTRAGVAELYLDPKTGQRLAFVMDE